jgi:hypothetical protein
MSKAVTKEAAIKLLRASKPVEEKPERLEIRHETKGIHHNHDMDTDVHAMLVTKGLPGCDALEGIQLSSERGTGSDGKTRINVHLCRKKLEAIAGMTHEEAQNQRSLTA